MTNTTQNKEFNRAIKQLQAMVRDKQIISLAEKFYNLKVEMSSLTRSVKEKESSLILEQAKTMAQKPEIKTEIKTEDRKIPYDKTPGRKYRKAVSGRKTEKQCRILSKPNGFIMGSGR